MQVNKQIKENFSSINIRGANSQAECINEGLNEQQEISDVLEALLTLDGRVRMLLMRDGTYVAGSSGLEEFLEAGSPLFLKGGVVRAVARKYADLLRAILEVRAPTVRTFVMHSTNMDGHLIIRATSIWESVICLSLQLASPRVTPELPDLQALFKLTKTEASIVSELFLGSTPQGIAVDHHNSIHTVRAHIRRCYDKLEVTCREELWRKLNSYRIM